MWPRSRAHRSRISSAESTGSPRRRAPCFVVRRSREQISPGRRGLAGSPSTAANTGTCPGSFGKAQPRNLAPVTCVNRAPSGSTASQAWRSRQNSSSRDRSSLSRRNNPWLTRRNPLQRRCPRMGSSASFFVRHGGEDAQAPATRNCAPCGLWIAAWAGFRLPVWSPTAGNGPESLRLVTKPRAVSAGPLSPRSRGAVAEGRRGGSPDVGSSSGGTLPLVWSVGSAGSSGTGAIGALSGRLSSADGWSGVTGPRSPSSPSSRAGGRRRNFLGWVRVRSRSATSR